jgi:hypothetical protein
VAEEPLCHTLLPARLGDAIEGRFFEEASSKGAEKREEKKNIHLAKTKDRVFRLFTYQ